MSGYSGGGIPAVIGGLTILDGLQSMPQTAFLDIAAAGLYRISVYMEVIYAVGGASGDCYATIFWTDNAAIERSQSTGTISIPGRGATQMTITAQLAASSSVSYLWQAINNAAGARTWQMFVTVERLQ